MCNGREVPGRERERATGREDWLKGTARCGEWLRRSDAATVCGPMSNVHYDLTQAAAGSLPVIPVIIVRSRLLLHYILLRCRSRRRRCFALGGLVPIIPCSESISRQNSCRHTIQPWQTTGRMVRTSVRKSSGRRSAPSRRPQRWPPPLVSEPARETTQPCRIPPRKTPCQRDNQTRNSSLWCAAKR